MARYILAAARAAQQRAARALGQVAVPLFEARGRHHEVRGEGRGARGGAAKREAAARERRTLPAHHANAPIRGGLLEGAVQHLRKAVKVSNNVKRRRAHAAQRQLEGKECLHHAKDGAHDGLQHPVRRAHAGRRAGERALEPRHQRLPKAREEHKLKGDDARDLTGRAPVRSLQAGWGDCVKTRGVCV
jgi:hypothetical protein